MPWKYATYKFSFKKNDDDDFYAEYKMEFKSKLGKGQIEIESNGNKMQLLDGFKNIEEQIHILTHPIIGYYNMSNKKLGTYEIWHPEIDLNEGKAKNLYFEIFEKLGFLTKLEMNNPHSVLITPRIEFDILLPPRRIKKVGNNVYN